MERNKTDETGSKDKPAKKPQEENGSPVEIGGQAGPEPTRFGDWEKNGRCTDF